MGIDETGRQFLVAFVVVLIAAVPVLLILRSLRILDVTGERSSHTDAVPRAGGIALLLGLCAGLAAGPSADQMWWPSH